jgi:hypothetical protein
MSTEGESVTVSPKRTRKPRALAPATKSKDTSLSVDPTINASESIDTSKGELSELERKFARAVADGIKASRAYRMVWGECKNSDVLSSNVMGRDRVRREIVRVRDEINAAFLGSAIERRKVLWDTIRAKPKDRPGHGDRIQAIKLDAQLAGELEPQRDTVAVTLGLVLGSLTSHSIKQAEQVVNVEAVSVSQTPGSSDKREPIAPAAIAGPFGRIPLRDTGCSTVEPARAIGLAAKGIVVDEA